ncbi:MAG: Rne/Rng family ribonuclease, partial [Deltaproteobacteria bacterium]
GEKVYLRRGDRIIVQVTKDESPMKGAVLTSYISIAGRYLVLMLGMKKTGISKRIQDEEVREKLRSQVEKLSIPENMGVIVRTAGAGGKLKDFRSDLKMLKTHWQSITKKAKEMEGPGILYAEQDLVTRFLRDYYDPAVTRVIVDTEEAYQRAQSFFQIYAPSKKEILFLYREKPPLFDHYEVTGEVERSFGKRVELPSGGFLIIDVTEAFVTIDVNSGKSVKEKDLEETAFRTNLEAAREIPRQLRLRDLGGIIIVDFIDMYSRAHKKEVERTLRAEMKRDRARYDIGTIGRFGVLTLTRQRLGTSPLDVSYERCHLCAGFGRERKPHSVSAELFRTVLRKCAKGGEGVVKFRLSPGLFEYVANHLSGRLDQIYQFTGTRVELTIDLSLSGFSYAEG